MRAASHRSKQPTDPSSVVNIFEKSFRDIDIWKSQQINKPDPDIVAVHPIFPDESMVDTNVTMGEFLVNPEYLQGTEEEGSRSMNLNYNILTNIRMIEGKTLTEQNTTFISMVAKKAATTKDDDMADDTSADNAAAVTEDGELYSHVKDFRTELEADNRTFVWYFDDEKKEMKFLPVTSTIRMKRVSNEDASWHDVYVKRRKHGEPEEELPDEEEEDDADEEEVGADEEEVGADVTESESRIESDMVQ